MTRNQRAITLELILLVKPWNSVGKYTVQDSEFVRWRSAFHHVFVLTVKKRCVLFIEIVEYTLYIETFLCKNIFSHVCLEL